MKNGNRWIALSVLGAMMLSTVGGAFTAPAEASTKGRRNTTIALGALTAYGLIKKKKTLAIGAGVGTAIAYSRYRKSKKRDGRRSRLWYQQRYGRNWKRHYYHGRS